MGQDINPRIPPASDIQPDASKKIPALLILVFILTLVTVFFAPMFSGKSLIAPDFSHAGAQFDKDNFPAFAGGGWLEQELGQSTLPLLPTPARLILLKLLPPDTYRYASFMLYTVLLFLASAYWLRGKGLLWTATLIGSLAMAFSGQSFTIISAGHLGKFSMMPCAVLLLGLLDRAIERRSLFHYALAGCIAGMGMFEQPDVMVLFYLLAASYALYKLIQQRPAGQGSIATFATRHLGGILLAGLVFFVTALPPIMSTLGIRVTEREKVKDESSFKPYDFATCWSLPPEETIEFIVPSFFGIQSGDQDLPYWGRLGQSRIGDNNTVKRLGALRQHSLYLGVFQVLFALYAVGLGIRNLKRNDRSKAMAETTFWSLALLATFLLALGRYTPLYKAFYMLPFISSMRCPVKFMHLIEVCTVFLFAVGLDHFLRDILCAPAKSKKQTKAAWRPSPILLLFVVASIAAAIGAMVVSSSGRDFSEIWSVLPSPFNRTRSLMEDRGTALMGNMVSGLVRTSLIAAIGAILIAAGLVLRGRPQHHSWLTIVMCCVVATDMATADVRYIRVADMSSLVEKNIVLRTLDPVKRPFRVGLFHSDLAYPGRFDQVCEELFSTAQMNGIDFVRSPHSAYFAYLSMARTLNGDGAGFRFWQLISADYIFGPIQLVARLAKAPGIQLVAAFDIVADGKGFYTWQKKTDSKGMYVLVRNSEALPRASVYHDWRCVTTNNLQSSLTDQSWDPRKLVLIEHDLPGTPPGGAPTPVSSLNYSRNAVEITVTSSNKGVVLLTDLQDSGWRATVDNRDTSILRCNGGMRGVMVEAGTHTIKMRYTSKMARAAQVQAAGMILMCIVTLVMIGRYILRRRDPATSVSLSQIRSSQGA